METLSALLILCLGNSPVTDEFPSQRPVKRGFDYRNIWFQLTMEDLLNLFDIHFASRNTNSTLTNNLEYLKSHGNAIATINNGFWNE